MSGMQVQIAYTVTMLAWVAIGFYCATRLNGEYPLWVRMVVLSPCLMALGVLALMAQGQHTAYLGDLMLSISTGLLYALVASRFSARPWLDLRTHKTPQDHV
jgi:O-antigen/teichoic acid export membrane protein